ncbi:hypothetical protein FHG87_006591 [Trinorchestia longiramus]|nr:hypothetical protein FHG87_006591 [Trinorchestia longiramus]
MQQTRLEESCFLASKKYSVSQWLAIEGLITKEGGVSWCVGYIRKCNILHSPKVKVSTASRIINTTLWDTQL